MPQSQGCIWTMLCSQPLESKARWGHMMTSDDREVMEESSCLRSEEAVRRVLITLVVEEAITTKMELINKTMQWFQSWCLARRAMRGWWNLMMVVTAHHLYNSAIQTSCRGKPQRKRIRKYCWLPTIAQISPEPKLDHRTRRACSTMTRLHQIFLAKQQRARQVSWLWTQTQVQMWHLATWKWQGKTWCPKQWRVESEWCLTWSVIRCPTDY